MKIWIYCQHVLGMGHFFRTIEIARALYPDDVLLITGGKKIPVRPGNNIRTLDLPGLMMDDNFNSLYCVDPDLSVETVQSRRRAILMDLLRDERPDIFLIELYPFGRRAFEFELEPVLEYIHQTGMPCRVLCSLRDILVEKKDTSKYESRVIQALNKWFDAVLVHSDPALIRLDTTFLQISQVAIPIVYTGFVTPLPNLQTAFDIRSALLSSDDMSLVVASVGSGSVGASLLKAVVKAFPLLPDAGKVIIKVFTGPYMDPADVDEIQFLASGYRIYVEAFTQNFVSMLKAADLSISMAGYNTCMNIVAADIPSFVYPFNQNREQRLRAEKLTLFSDMVLLEDSDLDPERLASLIHDRLNTLERERPCIQKQLDLKGAIYTAEWIRDQYQ